MGPSELSTMGRSSLLIKGPFGEELFFHLGVEEGVLEPQPVALLALQQVLGGGLLAVVAVADLPGENLAEFLDAQSRGLLGGGNLGETAGLGDEFGQALEAGEGRGLGGLEEVGAGPGRFAWLVSSH